MAKISTETGTVSGAVEGFKNVDVSGSTITNSVSNIPGMLAGISAGNDLLKQG